MTLDDGTADREPDNQTMGFGCVERLEQLVHAARIQADAGVTNQQLDAVTVVDLEPSPRAAKTKVQYRAAQFSASLERV